MSQLPNLDGIDPIIRKAMEGLPADFANFPRIFQDDIQPTLASRCHRCRNAWHGDSGRRAFAAWENW